jgi:hypothetical protein
MSGEAHNSPLMRKETRYRATIFDASDHNTKLKIEKQSFIRMRPCSANEIRGF